MLEGNKKLLNTKAIEQYLSQKAAHVKTAIAVDPSVTIAPINDP